MRPGARSGRAAWPSPPRARRSPAAVLVEAAVVDRLVERGATHHAFLKVTLAGSQAGVGTLTPSFQCGLTIGLGHGRLEGTRMDQSHEAGNMSEAERGGQTGLDRATSGLATELVLTTADAPGAS